MSSEALIPSPAAGVVAQVAAAAEDVDRRSTSVRGHVERLADAGVAALGAPANRHGELISMARLISELAGVCMSTSFALWAHRMTIEYLRLADTPWANRAAEKLERGEVLGVTGMASAFKEAAGCGSIDLDAAPTGSDAEGPAGWSVNGTLRWASNLHPDSIMVTAARTDDGRRLVVGIPLNQPGVEIGAPFDLLAMGGTDSSYVTLNEVVVPGEQVLTEDFETFLGVVRPTFLVLQSAMCLGLADRCLRQSRDSLGGVNASVADDVEELGARWLKAWSRMHGAALAVGTFTPGEGADRRGLLGLRLEAAELATSAAGLEIRTAGGRGYARQADVSRRFREATFLPVQSPSETQLRWELGRLREAG